MEEMSELSQVVESQATTGEGLKLDDKDTKWVMTMVCGFLNMALVIGIVVLLTHTSVETAGGDDDASSSSKSPGGGGSGNPRPSPPAVLPTTDSGEVTSHGDTEAATTSGTNATVEATTNETATDAETTTTTTKRTKKPFTKVTPQPPGLPRGWFICVARTFTVSTLRVPLTFPEDGVCDLIYYESVCLSRLSGEFSMYGRQQQQTYTADQQLNKGSGPHLLNAAKTYVKSRFGIAFCFEARAQEILGSDKPLFESWLRFFTDNNIHDTAVFNIRDTWRNERDTGWEEYPPEKIRLPFDLLKFMKTYSTPNSPSSVRYTALAVQVFSQEINERIIDYLKTVYTPDAILTYGHLWAFKEKAVPSFTKVACQLHPPHNYYDGKTRNYNHQNSSTMADHVEYLLSFKKAGIDAHYSIMLTAGATRDKMRFPDNRNPALGNYAIYSPCLAEQEYDKKRDFVGAKEIVCEDPIFRRNMQFQEDAKSWVTFNKNWKVEQSIAFDTEDSLRWKVCNLMVKFAGEQVGAVAVDLDFDNKTSTCPGWESGPFERVKLIKNLNTFFQKEFWDPTDLYFCLQVNSTLDTT